MITKNLQKWWQQYRETLRCSSLRRELWLLLYGAGEEEKLANRLIQYEKYKCPGKLESWYLDKAIYNFRSRLFNDRDR